MATATLTLADVSAGNIIWWLVIGLITGFLASLVMRGGGYGIVGDIIVGLVGALVGGFLAGLLGIGSSGLIGSLIMAFIGSCSFIAILRAVSGTRVRTIDFDDSYKQRTYTSPTQQASSPIQKLPAAAYYSEPEQIQVQPIAQVQPVATPSTPPGHPSMPTVKPPFFVFVSHSSRDDAFGQMLARDLRKELGSEEAVWYDSDGGLYGGDSWWSRIVSVISMCDIFIIIISPDSMGSRWVMREFDIAFAQNKIIVPVLYRQTQMRADLQTIQYISFAGGSDSYKTALNRLLQSIRH